MTEKVNADLLAAAELTLKLLADMTTEQFGNGADRPAREALANAIKKAKGEQG